MMTEYSFYDASTGKFTGVRYGTSNADELALNLPAGQGATPGNIDHNTMRFDVPTSAVVARGPAPISASVAGLVVTLAGVPSDAAYTITGDAALTGAADASGALVLTFGAPGTYVLDVACFPLLDYQGSFTLS